MYYLLKWIKFSVKKNNTLKKYWKKWQKILEKSGNFVSPEKWEPCEQKTPENGNKENWYLNKGFHIT